MALNLYLDDCSNSDLLAGLLRYAGHHVTRPTDPNIDMEGASDDAHFAFAAAHQLAIITKNPADFLALHTENQQHSGILGVYQDNDPDRDMSQAEIVNAIANLEAAAATGADSIAGHFHSLNDWRF